MGQAVKEPVALDAVLCGQTHQGAAKRQFSTFWVSGRLFGVDILAVKEVNLEASFTPIFHAPQEVKGYVNIRGQIYLILDLRKLIGLGNAEREQSSRLVLFKPSVGESFGVLVDTVGDVIEVGEDAIEDRRRTTQGLPEGSERRAEGEELVAGVCKLPDALLVVLNAGNLLKAIDRRQHA